MSNPSPATVRTVFTRDEGSCSWCGLPISGTRGIDFSVHHRAPRSMGGSSRAWVNLPGNLVFVHGSGVTLCHGYIESHRDEARGKGFLVSANGIHTASEVPIVHAVHGTVILLDDGLVADA